MKIQCDVCNKAAATVFCAAEEAALCSSCDRLVHQANKLASRHPRLSLLQSPHNCSKQSHHLAPLCDICQERGAIMFCQQDRAVLCKDCDIPIHAANEHTRKHSRFLLTRVELSTLAPPHPPLFPNLRTRDINQKPASISEVISSPLSMTTDSLSCDHWAGGGSGGSSLGSGEMLPEVVMMEMLQGGWHLKDLVDSCSTSVASFGFTKTDDGSAPSPNAELENHPTCPLFLERTGIWIPDAPAPKQHPTRFSLPPGTQAVSFKESSNSMKGDGFTIPQVIIPCDQDLAFSQ